MTGTYTFQIIIMIIYEMETYRGMPSARFLVSFMH